jgi:hypothetical protein
MQATWNRREPADIHSLINTKDTGRPYLCMATAGKQWARRREQ